MRAALHAINVTRKRWGGLLPHNRERIKGTTFYGAYLCTGEIKTWRCEPGRKPKRVPFSEIVDDGALIITARNVDDRGNSWPHE